MKHPLLCVLFLAALVLAALAGCQAHPFASLSYIHPAIGQVKVETDQTAFELVKPRKMEILTVKVWAAPEGEPAPDYEYLYLLLPEDDGTFQVGPTGATVYRLVSKDGQETLYRGVSGTVTSRRLITNDNRTHTSFDVAMKLIWPLPTDQSTTSLTGHIYANEDARLCASMLNNYEPPLRRLKSRAAEAGGQIAPDDEKNKPSGLMTKKKKTPPPAAPAVPPTSAQPAQP
jgi:hypothetical protein